MTPSAHRYGSAPSTPETSEMVTALVQLREALRAADLPLDLPGVEAQRRTRVQLIDQLEDYVLPRLVQIDAPLLTVQTLAGGTMNRVSLSQLAAVR